MIGEPIQLNDARYTIIGVAAKNFAGLHWLLPVDFWAPVQAWPDARDDLTRRETRFLSVLGRLNSGVTKQQAEVEVNGIAGQLALAYPATNRGRELVLSSGEESKNNAGTFVSLLVMSLVSLVLLISCANVANLLLIQADKRRRETAVRLALGASRSRLVRQLLTESTVLSLVGSAVGMGLAFCLIALLPALEPAGTIPFTFDIQMDGRVLMYTLMLSVVTTAVFGLAPALQASAPNLTSALKGEEGRGRRGSRRFTARNVLVVAQIMVSVFLLVGTGLLLRSYWNTREIHPGFDESKQMLLTLVVQRSEGDFRDVVERIKALPGVERASFSRYFPMSGSGVVSREVSIPGTERDSRQPAMKVRYNVVGDDYFPTMGTRVLRGRQFERRDSLRTARVVMINESMAHRFWANDDPVDTWFEIEGENHQVIGIVEDGRYDTLREPVQPFMFLPFRSESFGELNLLVETAVDPVSLVGAVRQTLRLEVPDLWVVNTVTLQSQMRLARYLEEMSAGLVGALCLLAVLLSSVDLFGVVSNAANRRRHEIAVRMAMGATRLDIARMVLGHGLGLLMVGLPCGLVAVYVAASYMGSLLYGVATTDPASYVAGSVVALAIALVASQAPARKVMSVHPAVVLRSQ